MNKTFVAVALVAMLGGGCKKKRSEEAPEPAGGTPAMAGSPDPGAAAKGSAGSAGSASSATPAPVTAEAIVARFEKCWGFWNASAWADFKSCYAADATVEVPGLPVPAMTGSDAIVAAAQQNRAPFPDERGDIQLELVHGKNLVAVVLVAGTHTEPLTGPMGTLPPTHKKVGFLFAQALSFNDAGQATHDAEYFDTVTMMGQLAPNKDHPVRPALDKLAMPKATVIARDDAQEKANLAADQALFDAFNKHDAKAFADAQAGDLVWSEQSEPKDHDKKTNVDLTAAAWRAFSDLQLASTQRWAAGDYVITQGTFSGTNDGDAPEMKMKKTGKKISVPFLQIDQLAGGKVKAVWIFYQSMAVATQLGLAAPPAPPAAGSAGSAAATKTP